jgi:hypothetical protein
VQKLPIMAKGGGPSLKHKSKRRRLDSAKEVPLLYKEVPGTEGVKQPRNDGSISVSSLPLTGEELQRRKNRKVR